MKGCLTIILLVVLLLTGCADSGDSANEQATSEEKSTNERTARRENRAILMGVITDVYHVKRTTSRQVAQHKWITVDEDPDANCREGPVESGCEKPDFDLNEARVWRQEGSSRRAASVADLKEGQSPHGKAGPFRPLLSLSFAEYPSILRYSAECVEGVV